MLFNRQARALGSVFILLVFIFSGLYGGIILERVDQVAAIDIVSTCVIAACYFLVVVFFIFEKPGDSWSKDVCDKSTRVFICVGLAIAVLRLMFIFLWAI
jgi:EamA domain-containing membrane protein RarD